METIQDENEDGSANVYTMRLKFFHSHYQEILDPFSVPGTALRCDIAVYTTKLLP